MNRKKPPVKSLEKYKDIHKKGYKKVVKIGYKKVVKIVLTRI